MKENVGYLKHWIERVLNLKNRTIDNLMLELDEAEFQYSHNFQAHIAHIQEIIEKHQKCMNKMHEQYESDCQELSEASVNETESVKANSNDNEMFLKMLMYGFDKKMEEDMRKSREKFMNNYDDVISFVSIFILLIHIKLWLTTIYP